MKKKKIWGHTLVKNEGRYIYFALTSVIDFLDRILVWDTGSTDDTVKIIKHLQKKYPQKIEFREIGSVDPKGLTEARQKMLQKTQSDWFMIVDGDEVWWRKSMQQTIHVIGDKGNSLYAMVHPVINLIGDIYHFQEESAGKYQMLGKKGHLNIRAINRRIPGLHIKNSYPLEGFYDKSERLIQEMDEKLAFINEHLMHFTHLNRSSKGKSRKIKYELGLPLPKDFIYPEVLHFDFPSIVPTPWLKRSAKYIARAAIETPLKKMKRRLKWSVPYAKMN